MTLTSFTRCHGIPHSTSHSIKNINGAQAHREYVLFPHLIAILSQLQHVGYNPATQVIESAYIFVRFPASKTVPTISILHKTTQASSATSPTPPPNHPLSSNVPPSTANNGSPSSLNPPTNGPCSFLAVAKSRNPTPYIQRRTQMTPSPT